VKKLFLYIDSMQFGGAQRVMNNLASYFVGRDYKVVLINDILPDSNAPEYDIDRRIKRYFLDSGNDGGQNKNLFRIKKLRKLVIAEQPDVILSFLGPPNIRMLVATLGLKCRKIVSVRNDPYKEYGDGIKRIVARMTFRFADGCVFQTKDAAAYFPEAVQKKSRIIVNPVNEKFYHVSWTGSNKEIAVVGRLQPQKNPLLALEAFKLIAPEFPEFKIVFYGDEELRDNIVAKGQEYGLEDRVIIYGKAADIENKLASSAIYVLSSDYEGMPNALMEAMAVGVPVISTDCPCGGPRFLIENSKQGILVPCGDVFAMASAMRMLLDNKEMSINIGKAAKKRANDFSNDVILKKWDDYFNEVIRR